VKPHLIIKLKSPLRGTNVPYWIDFISDKRNEINDFDNDIDRIFDKYNIDVWITQEFDSADDDYSKEEIKHQLDRIYRVIFKQDNDIPDNLINEIYHLPYVDSVRPIAIGSANIPRYSLSQEIVMPTDKARSQIFLKEAQLYSKGQSTVRIAVLDTGIDAEHPELSSSIEKMADFVNLEGLDTSGFVGDFLGYDAIPEDEVGHGTHVSGELVARGLKIPEGIVPECKLIAVRVLATLKQGDRLVGAGLIDNINVGIKWAVDNGADIINMSLGVKHEYGGLPHQEVINYAISKGVTVVAAAGNDGTGDLYYPGALPGVIAVGAVDENDQVAAFSNYGAHVSFLAPGTNILSSFKNHGYAVCSGTSQAAPFVTGGIALLKSYAKQNGITLQDHQIKFLLKQTSDKIDSQFKTEKGGFGRINLIDAIRLLNYKINHLN
jgi:hypothetical protein